eukprot:scaffold40219_cov69-Phaeocystis_antarctica.AAC.1
MMCNVIDTCQFKRILYDGLYAPYGLSPDFRLRVLASSRSMMLAPSYTSKYGSVRTPLAL